jgi:hypothetical protein
MPLTSPLGQPILCILISGCLAGLAESTVILKCDFSDPTKAGGELYNFWSVHNHTERFPSRLRPANQDGAKANLIRLLGGWPSGELSADSYQWDGSEYVYDWTGIKKRIDEKLESGYPIHQIVLDNPPWAFQRGFKLVDEADGEHYLKEDANALYGNSLPPDDPKAWSDFVKALMKELIATYGRETVEGWRFRVGTEIDTRPKHWAGTMQEYFNHYKNTVEAVHSVLPTVKVGAQFREASMKPKYVDYKGNIEPPYGPPFVKWAKENDVHYDFIGTSYYPRYNLATKVDLEHMYEREHAPMAEHPDWRAGATFEIHEFKPITEIKEGRFLMLNSSHSAAFYAMFADLVYDKGIAQVYQWPSVSRGLHSGESMAQKALIKLVGAKRHQGTVEGTPEIEGNKIDAIFSHDAERKEFEILAYNYNANPDYQRTENSTILLKLPVPPGTSYELRSVLYDESRNSFQQFVRDHPKAGLWEKDGGWVKDGYIKHGQLDFILNKEGVKTLRQNSRKYVEYNELDWSEWRLGKTRDVGEKKDSVVEISVPLPSFSFHAYTLRIKD